MKIYDIKPIEPFEAVQFLREDAELVCEWSDSTHAVYRERDAERDVHILLWPLPDGGEMIVRETDWIIKDTEGLFVCTDKEFEERYMVRGWRQAKR